MIGVNIGVPAPARRLENNPQERTRSITVLAVAGGAVLAVLLLAFVISRAGGSADPGAEAGATGTPTTAAGASATATSSITPIPAGTSAPVPELTGLTEVEAAGIIEATGWTLKVMTEKSASQPKGTVLQQSPAEGVLWPSQNQVILVVSDGP